jgi:mannose-6-phosphate isomerase
MANSDNVLRGGLTPKHVDLDELLHVTNAVPGPLPLVMPVDISAQIFPEPGQVAGGTSESHQWIGQEWPVPVDDFRLVRVTGQSSAPCHLDVATRPMIALCAHGEVRLQQGPDAISLGRGESAIAGNSDSPLSVSGSGTLFLASAG